MSDSKKAAPRKSGLDPAPEAAPPETRADHVAAGPASQPAAIAEPEPEPAAEAARAAEPPPQVSALVVDLDAVRADERRATLAYVAEVHELCALAGRGDLVAGFVAKATAIAQVRRALLEARTAEDEATAIRSQVRPATIEPAQPAIDTAAIYAARNRNVR
jgi:hypothetical protein